MRHGASGRRQRNRGNGGRNGGQPRVRVYDSNGPDVRIRGTAHQVCEKYLALAKDAAGADNAILAESYLQHAEHYQRLINRWDEDLGMGGESHDKKYERKGRGKRRQAEDDLSLPASILGADSKADAETRTPVAKEAPEAVE